MAARTWLWLALLAAPCAALAALRWLLLAQAAKGRIFAPPYDFLGSLEDVALLGTLTAALAPVLALLGAQREAGPGGAAAWAGRSSAAPPGTGQTPECERLAGRGRRSIWGPRSASAGMGRVFKYSEIISETFQKRF